MGTVTSGSRHGHIKITSGTHRDRREHGEIIARSRLGQHVDITVELRYNRDHDSMVALTSRSYIFRRRSDEWAPSASNEKTKFF